MQLLNYLRDTYSAIVGKPVKPNLSVILPAIRAHIRTMRVPRLLRTLVLVHVDNTDLDVSLLQFFGGSDEFWKCFTIKARTDVTANIN